MASSGVTKQIADGRALVDDIVEWDFLFSWKPKHKMRRGIDRRFDGPKHLRTRDYDSESDNSYAGLGGWCTGDY